MVQKVLLSFNINLSDSTIPHSESNICTQVVHLVLRVPDPLGTRQVVKFLAASCTWCSCVPSAAEPYKFRRKSAVEVDCEKAPGSAFRSISSSTWTRPPGAPWTSLVEIGTDGEVTDHLTYMKIAKCE